MNTQQIKQQAQIRYELLVNGQYDDYLDAHKQANEDLKFKVFELLRKRRGERNGVVS